MRRPSRVTLALAVTLLLGLAVQPATSSAATPAELAALNAAPCPKYQVAAIGKYTQAAKDAALTGSFFVFDHMTTVIPPVDWRQGGAKSFQAGLNSLTFLDVALQMARDGSRPAFDRAVAIEKDFITANPSVTPGDDRSWYNKTVADRSAYIAYTVRLGACRGWLDTATESLLLDSVRDHALWTLRAPNYAGETNHGLYQDVAVMTLVKYMHGILADATSDWQTRAVARFKANLGSRYDPVDFIFLEHSLGYHLGIVNLVSRVLTWGLSDDPYFAQTKQRMVDAAGWFATPDTPVSLIPQLGDTNRTATPKWALAASTAQAQGLAKMLHTGYAIVRSGSSYLIQSALYWGPQHKHSDELSFELHEKGKRIIADPGKESYEPTDPYRIYAQSAAAHSGVVVDGGGWQWRGNQPYGSALDAAGTNGTWYAIQGNNPLTQPLGVTHRRMLIYLPGATLIVLDDLSSLTPHQYTRLLHFDAAMHVQQVTTSLTRASAIYGNGGINCSIRDWTPPSLATAMTIVKGQTNPIQGWTFPGSSGERVAAPVLSYDNSAANALLTMSVACQTDPPVVTASSWTGDTASVTVLNGGVRHRIDVTRNGSDLGITDTVVP